MAEIKGWCVIEETKGCFLVVYRQKVYIYIVYIQYIAQECTLRWIILWLSYGYVMVILWNAYGMNRAFLLARYWLWRGGGGTGWNGETV